VRDRSSVAVNAISNNEAMRFGLDKLNKDNQIMRKMGWRAKVRLARTTTASQRRSPVSPSEDKPIERDWAASKGGAKNSSKRSGGAKQCKQQKCKQEQHQRKARWVDTEMRITARRAGAAIREQRAQSWSLWPKVIE
jgi:hypothetical protein